MFKTIYSYLKFIYCVLVTLPRDLYGLFVLFNIERTIGKWEKNGDTVAKVFYKLVKKNPNKPCLMFENRTLTFQDVEDYSNQVAHAFAKKYNLKKGDAVSLFMENRPEFICTWLGLSKIGVITAFINTNLKTQALVHSINVAKSKALIYGTELTESVNQVRNELGNQLIYVSQGPNSQTKDADLDDIIKKASKDSFIPEEPIKTNDILMYIYTSGTTGLPKPAVIKHNRYLGGGFTFFYTSKMTQNDVMYNSLPLYHANGGLIATGSAIVCGATMVIRKKFSATNFWKECIQYNCTAMIYVGEVCRYLVNQPPSEYDRKHKVRIAVGNGLRPIIWPEFVSRFGIRPYEFYAASEGNCTIVNLTGQPGACGFLPVLHKYLKLLPLTIVKIDDQMEPIRDHRGYCMPTKPYERGLAVGIIGEKTSKAYSGYANNSEASKKKILDNVLTVGQKGFNSGDMLMYDDLGYIYFCDRLGDTYRWRGENVSTVEVENIISSKINSTEVVVYGVEVPGQEGRAGMATILSADIDIDKLSDDLKQNLPTYARPLFIRLVENIDHTGSFRAQKNKLTDIGYNIDVIKDKLYYFDPTKQKYLPLTKDVYNAIKKNSIRL